ncbi:taste receptor type 2 member 13-like [Ascaphus truei]|uniref:taste receptor type 2 member 13-like n=1 Tax=Ascaphus truei TaxID=8439 RepID=UPI003F5939E1
MPSVFRWALTVVEIVAFLMGVATNGFVLGVNLCDWTSSRHHTSSDQYMCGMAVSNLSLQVWAGAKWICDLVRATAPLCQVIYALRMVSTHCSLSLTAWLCVFYCIRIVVFHHCLLQRLQRYMSYYYHQVILCTCLMCLLLGLPLAWNAKGSAYNSADSSVVNGSNIAGTNWTLSMSYAVTYRTVLIFGGYIAPLLVILLSAGLIMRSLTKHMKRMRVTMETGHKVRMEAHLSAGCTVLCLLLLFIGHFVFSMLIVIDLFPDGDMRLAICQLASTLYSPMHGLVLIRGNGKLRRASAGVVRKLCGVKG